MKESIDGLIGIAGNSGNDIISLIVVVLIGLPLITFYMKTRSDEKHARHKEQMEREKQHQDRERTYMDVISGNTAALVKLTTLLESNNQNCIECRAEQTALYKDLIEKQDVMHIEVVKIKERI